MASLIHRRRFLNRKDTQQTVFGAAITVDGSAFWTSGFGTGTSGGVHYIPFGNTSGSTQISTTVTNTRYLSIFNGQLYVTSGSGLNTVGTGSPTTSGQTITLFSPTGNAGNSYASYFLDRDAGVAGLDTLYLSSDQAGGLFKYSFDGSTWTAEVLQVCTRVSSGL